jgi:hypothetical protein
VVAKLRLDRAVDRAHIVVVAEHLSCRW